MVSLEQSPHGVVIPVQAQPGARKNGIVGEHAGRLKVAVTQAPEKGKANQALIEVLANALGIKRSQITLLSGETSSKKKFLVTGVDLLQLRDKIDVLLTST